MIVFTRQLDGTFKREGEFVEGARLVRIIRDEREGLREYKPREAVEIIEAAIAAGNAPASEYRLVETKVDTAEVVAGRKANLAKARAARKSKKEEIE